MSSNQEYDTDIADLRARLAQAEAAFRNEQRLHQAVADIAAQAEWLADKRIVALALEWKRAQQRWETSDWRFGPIFQECRAAQDALFAALSNIEPDPSAQEP